MPRFGSAKSLMVLLAGIPLMAAPAAEADTRRSCERKGSRTIAKNRFVRVYQVRRADAKELFACRRSSGRRRRLARAFDDLYTSAGFSQVRLNGYYVAWADTATDVSCKAACPPEYEPTRTSIEVYNVRRRRRRSVAASAVGGGLVVSRRGAVAWAGRAGSGGPVEIRASLRRGDDRLIDSGNIDPSSLAIEITIISWLRDGVERFARLR